MGDFCGGGLGAQILRWGDFSVGGWGRPLLVARIDIVSVVFVNFLGINSNDAAEGNVSFDDASPIMTWARERGSNT